MSDPSFTIVENLDRQKYNCFVESVFVKRTLDSFLFGPKKKDL